MHWIYLILAIIAEIVATTALKASNGFTNLSYGLIALACYGVAFYLLSLVLLHISVGVAYAIWAGVGVAAIALIGWVAFGQTLDLAAIIGIGMIIGGVVVLNTLSNSVR